jgi:hypothetical protein
MAALVKRLAACVALTMCLMLPGAGEPQDLRPGVTRGPCWQLTVLAVERMGPI